MQRFDRPSTRERIASLVAPTALLATPLLTFLGHNGYDRLSSEVALLLLGTAVLGGVLGLVTAFGGTIARIVVLAFLVVTIVDFQSDPVDVDDAVVGLGVWLAAVAALFTVLRRHIAFIVMTAAVAMLVVALLPASRLSTAQEPRSSASARSDLPPVVHLVLDEHMGLEGIAREHDPDRNLRNQIRSFYEGAGFRVFGKAFSRHIWTAWSLSNLLNFDASVSTDHLVDRNGLSANAYFSSMIERGYEVRVHTPQLTRFCDTPGVEVASCHIYPRAGIGAIAALDAASTTKAQLLISVYLRRLTVTRIARKAYLELRAIAAERGATLPVWKKVPLLTAVATVEGLDTLQSEIAAARHGTLYFAHLLLPHYSYLYDSDCAVRPSEEWLSPGGGFLHWATPAADRSTLYPLYYEQVECTHRVVRRLFDAMRDSGTFEDAVIIVHSDHGSRLSVHHPPSDRDLIDLHSVLFAVKHPAIRPGYDLRLLPMDELLEQIVLNGRVPDGEGWVRSYRVSSGDMPQFRGGDLVSRKRKRSSR